jgi:hypothetical protein
MRFGPSPADQVPVPAEQCVWPNEEPSRASTIKEPTQPSEQRSICGSQGRSGHLATEHGNLVAEHDDFDRKFLVVVSNQAEPLEDSDEGEVEKRQGHGPVSSFGDVPRSPVQETE